MSGKMAASTKHLKSRVVKLKNIYTPPPPQQQQEKKTKSAFVLELSFQWLK